jgi:hypothetical protein
MLINKIIGIPVGADSSALIRINLREASEQKDSWK